jgi:hypothetical protein
VITTPLRHQLPGRRRRGRRTRSNTSRSGGLRRITPIRLSLVSRQESGRHDRSTYGTPAKLPASGLAGHSRDLVLTGRVRGVDRRPNAAGYEVPTCWPSTGRPTPARATADRPNGCRSTRPTAAPTCCDTCGWRTTTAWRSPATTRPPRGRSLPPAIELRRVDVTDHRRQRTKAGSAGPRQCPSDTSHFVGHVPPIQ